MKKAKFTSIDQMTTDEWQIIETFEMQEIKKLPAMIIEQLKLLGKGYHQPYLIDRLQHSLQTATRAYKNNASEEMVIAALIHDIGDNLAAYNHASFAAALIQPYVTEKTYWIVKHHDIFQGYYYWDVLGLDKNSRDKFKGHPYFDECDYFCREWDRPSFDPDYETMPLEDFIPMIEKVFTRKPYSFY